ncbi:MAG: RNA polymerase sigma factor [Actinobacteria bacterium]|nr:RNA polymerase sigma factor [Actinomycetota bacterium]
MEKSFAEIYRENYQRVLLFIYSLSADRALAEDIAQEALIKAYRSLTSLREKSKIPFWLNKIAYNLSLDLKRKKSSQLISVDDELLAETLADLRKSITLEADQQIMSECVQNKLLLLPENYRITLLLDIQGYSNREKAELLGCTLENAKIRLHRARQKMKVILGRDCNLYYDERNVLC